MVWMHLLLTHMTTWPWSIRIDYRNRINSFHRRNHWTSSCRHCSTREYYHAWLNYCSNWKCCMFNRLKWTRSKKFQYQSAINHTVNWEISMSTLSTNIHAIKWVSSPYKQSTHPRLDISMFILLANVLCSIQFDKIL